MFKLINIKRCSDSLSWATEKKQSSFHKKCALFYLLLLCGGSVGSLVEALLGLIVALFVEPDVLGGEALQSTHVGTDEGNQKNQEK